MTSDGSLTLTRIPPAAQQTMIVSPREGEPEPRPAQLDRASGLAQTGSIRSWDILNMTWRKTWLRKTG
jgi:hypothetical protein